MRLRPSPLPPALTLSCVATALALTPASAFALGRAGDLDPTFHGGAPATANLARTAPYSAWFSALVVDGSGRIVASGGATDANGVNAAAVARFNAGGDLDGSFGDGGSVVRQLGSGTNQYSFAGSVFTVPGRYVGFGSYRIVNGRSLPSAFQLRENGSPDLDVGSGGLLTTDPVTPPATVNTENAVAGPDGSVYVTGTADSIPGTGRQLALTKFGPQGQIAPGFGTRSGTWIGSFSENPSDSGTYGSALHMLPGNRLLAAGVALLPSGRFGGLLARFSTLTGQPDAAFGTRPGRTVIDASDPSVSAPDSTIEELAVAPDGAIYGGGYGEDAQGETAAMIARFTPLGRPDTSWGVGGVKRIQLATGESRSGVNDIVLQDDGKVVVSAFVSDGNGSSDTRIFRLRDDATLDPSFGVAGVASPQPGEDFSAGGLAIVGGRLLVAGSIRVGTRTVAAITRMLLAPLPDPPPPGPGPGPGPAPGPGAPGGPAGPPPPGPAGPGPRAVAGAIGLGATRLTVDRRGRVRIPLTCSRAGACAGRVAIVGARGRATIAARRRRAPRARRAAVFAQGPYRLNAGARATLLLRLPRAARARAASRRGLGARLVLAAQGARARTVSVKVVRG
jgi:uncharacterized delta-60 repeat protein